MPTIVAKATDHVKEMIDLIKILEQKGYTYKIDDGIYFDTAKFPEYGQLSNMPQEEDVSQSRIGVNAQKHNSKDFALWKFVDQSHIMKWDSPWGVGCPGWHIECSAMGLKYLGDRFDIHTGGEDHYYIHHENEIAQSDCAVGHKVVKTWMHCAFLLVDGSKMSKSLHNCYTLDELEERGFGAMDFRFFVLQTHYKKQLNFTFEALESAKTGYSRLHALVQANKDIECPLSTDDIFKISKFMDRFAEAVNDDLNTPEALAVLWEMLKTMPKSEDVYHYVMRMDEVLGLELDKPIEKKQVEIPDSVIALVEQRKEAKARKDYTLADKLREQINALGYEVKDTPQGYEIVKK